MKNYIQGLDFRELSSFVETQGKRSFVAKDLWHWIYKKRILDFDKMTSISKVLKTELENNFFINSLKLLKYESSKEDNTIKFLFELKDTYTIETVFIPQNNRYTLCVSTQVGCKMNCAFCKTGEMGFVRNLDTHEIVEQVTFVNKFIIDKNILGLGARDDTKAISNIVYMGMGEPLDNYDNTVKSIKIISDDRALGIGKRKITVSTSGLLDKVPKLHRETGVRIAISLNETRDKSREKLMPINKQWNIRSIVETIKKLDLKRHEFVTIEYVMFLGVNDDIQHAKGLASLLKGLKVKVNLIPYNSFEGASFKTTTDKNLHNFYDILVRSGLVCNVRYSKGKDISAACGQLRSKEQN